MRLLVATAVALVVAATAASSGSARATGNFTSARYAYSLLLPLDWSTSAATAAWDGVLSARRPGVDTFWSDAWAESLTGVSATTLKTRAAWHAQAARAVHADCAGPLVRGSTLWRFGGVRATMTAYLCSVGSYLTLVTLRRNDRGYAFAWRAHGVTAGSTWIGLEGILESIEFPQST
jgi:hypothetical protein